ncbi:MAG: recombinase family protein [bacterium]|nr:recombinase family protein [bacterium]
MNRPKSENNHLFALSGCVVEYPPGTRVVVYSRVSGRKNSQLCGGIARQAEAIDRQCRKYGLNVIAHFKESASGASLNPGNRPVFMEAIRHARRNEAIIVVHDLFRVVRNGGELSKRFEALNSKTRTELQQFVTQKEITIALCCHPDTPDRLLRSLQTKRGMALSSNKPGRRKGQCKTPFADQKRMLLLWRGGLSLPMIADHFQCCRNTVKKYIDGMCNTLGLQGRVASSTHDKTRLLHLGGLTNREIGKVLGLKLTVVRKLQAIAKTLRFPRLRQRLCKLLATFKITAVKYFNRVAIDVIVPNSRFTPKNTYHCRE